MAVSKTERQIKWATANTKSVTAGGNATSDAIGAIVAAEVENTQTVKADNAGTPADGDTIDVYLVQTAGDPDADPDSANEYPDTNHLIFLGQLDTFTSDPAIKTVSFPTVGIEDYKLYVESNAASNSITVSASGQGFKVE